MVLTRTNLRTHRVSQPLHLILPLWVMLVQCEGWGGADDSAMAEGVEPAGKPARLDEGVAPGSGGVVVAPTDAFCKI